MKQAILISSAYGWFAGLLTVMVIVTALFALILVIALKPIKKDELDDSSSAKKALGRRETELTIELLKKQNDAKARAELEGKLREVKAAEKLVEELVPEPEKPAPKKPVKAPAGKPAPKAPAKPAPEKPAEPVKPAKAPVKEEKPVAEKPVEPAKEDKPQEKQEQQVKKEN